MPKKKNTGGEGNNWISQLRKPSEIKTVPFDPSTHAMVRVNNRTWKQVAK